MLWLNSRVVVTEVVINVELFVVVLVVVIIVGLNHVFEVVASVVVVRIVGRRDGLGGLRMPPSPT